MPRVSICIPAYKPDFFEAALRSAIGQSFTDVEIIVSDDCPTNEIKEICDKFPGHIKYSRNPSPGLEMNFFRLMHLAEGEFIKFLCDDDILHPFCIDMLLDALLSTQQQNTRLAFSPRYYIDERNHLGELVNHFGAMNARKVIDGREFIRLTALHHRNFVGEYTTVLFRRADCFYEDGRFRLFAMEGNISRSLTDLNAWLELAMQGNLVVHPHPLSYFRRHENTTSNPAVYPRLVETLTYHESILNFAFEKAYLSVDELPQAFKNLIATYRYWLGTFPQLAENIARIEIALSAQE